MVRVHPVANLTNLYIGMKQRYEITISFPAVTDYQMSTEIYAAEFSHGLYVGMLCDVRVSHVGTGVTQTLESLQSAIEMKGPSEYNSTENATWPVR